MKFRGYLIGLAAILMVLFLVVSISDVSAQDDTPPEPTPDSVEVVNEYFSVVTTTTREGEMITAARINGPSEPPDLAAWEASRVTILDRAGEFLPNFPAYSWVYGCSAVSGAMIASYYDNNGYADIYTGPTNGGVMPQTEDPSWGSWLDGAGDRYPNNPLIASHLGLDGRTVRGSIDDYWIEYGSTASDPYITGSWTPHTWGTAIGDYMKTSQSVYDNVDGSTWFYFSGTQARLSCDTMEIRNYPDGNLGQKQFYEALGYTVTECYNQYIEPFVEGGFTLADYQAEIDAGHPVMISLTGHTVVGFGYDGSTIYIRDTWDSNTGNTVHALPWGGVYNSDFQMYGVSILHLGENSRDFSKTSPANMAVGVDPGGVTLSWEESFGAEYYEYCLNTSPSCSSWSSVGTNRSVTVSDLDDLKIYYWQVRAQSAFGTTDADGSESAFWSFTTFDSALLTEKSFIPLLIY